MSDLTLYWFLSSQPSRCVKFVLDYSKLPYKEVYIDISKGEQHKEDYMKINPKGLIPSLTDGDFSLSESNAILMYLSESRELPEHLYPKDLKVRT